MPSAISIDRDSLANLCRRWKVSELCLFGSVLRNDFGPDSDVDVLVTFSEDADWSLFDHMTMEEELSGVLGRKVDLVSSRGIERSRNWIRKNAILSGAERIYAAG